MEQFHYTIRDDLGLHARPAGLLVRLAMGYHCELQLAKNDRQASLKKIFTVMGLNVKCGDTVTVIASGDDEQQAIAALHDFFRQHL